MSDKKVDWKELAERVWDSPSWKDAAKQVCRGDPPVCGDGPRLVICTG
jgi:hypothetical protein